MHDIRKCIDKRAPNTVLSVCSKCGKQHRISIRSLAEGDDTCVRCKKKDYSNDERNTTSMSSKLFKSLYQFYLSFWDWINNRSDKTEWALVQSTTPVLYHIHKNADSASEEVRLEEEESRVLLTLFEAYTHWKISQSDKNWRRVFYAFWQSCRFYENS